MTGFHLKLIAVTAMLIDHIGCVFFPNVLILRAIGRIAFPIYAFLIAEGARHTSNIRNYFMRLMLFALLSEIPFNLAFSMKIWETGSCNVFFTLSLGLLAIIAVMKIENKLLKLISAAAVFALSILLNCDYDWYGVLMILGFYLVGNNRRADLMVQVCSTQLYCAVKAMEINTNMLVMTQQYSMLSLVPISLYNGQRGYNGKVAKFLFYAFYPAHLVIIWFINSII